MYGTEPDLASRNTAILRAPITTGYNPGLAQTLADSNASMARSQAWIKEVNSRPPITADMSPKVVAGRSVSAYSAPITPSAAQAGAISGNATAAASSGAQSVELAKKAAEGLNPIAATEFYKALGAALPGYRDVVNKMQQNTMSALKGELPPDVVNMIKMTSGEKQQQGALASTARNLGLTSLQRSDIGQTMGTNLLNLAKNNLTAPTYDVFSGYQNAFSQMFQSSAMSPSQAAQINLSGNAQAQQASEFDANMAWTRELSGMNMAFEREKMNVESGFAQQILGLTASSMAIESNAFSNMMGRTTSGGATGLEDLAHLGGGKHAPVASAAVLAATQGTGTPSTPTLDLSGFVSATPANLGVDFEKGKALNDPSQWSPADWDKIMLAQ